MWTRVIDIHEVFYSVTIQQQYIQSIIHSFGYMFRFHQTILGPIIIIWKYIQCVRTLWDPILFTLIKAEIIPFFNNFSSKLNVFFKKYIDNVFLKTYVRIHISA
jgi:hypothetical protein